VLKVFLVIVASMVAVDISLLAGLGIFEALDRHRHRRQVKELETLWRLEPGGSVRPLRPRNASVVRGRRLAGVAVAVVTLCAGTAFASPTAREAATSVLGTVARGLRLVPSEQDSAEAADPAGSSDPLPAVASGPPGAPDSPHVAPPHHSRGFATSSPVPSSAGDPARKGTDPATPDPEPSAETVPPPSSPTAITAVAVSSSDIHVDWSGVGGATGYEVQRSNDAAEGWSTVSATARDATEYIDSDRASGTIFYYRVIATNAGGGSAPSDVASATTFVDPASPPVVRATASSPTEIMLVWDDVAGETAYRIERLADSGEWIVIATTGQDETIFIDGTLAPATEYVYRVFATNAGGDSAPSDPASATTPLA
jgi:hypothetical protein